MGYPSLFLFNVNCIDAILRVYNEELNVYLDTKCRLFMNKLMRWFETRSITSLQ